MSDATVNLPTPPEGMEWQQQLPTGWADNGRYSSVSAHWKAVPIAPDYVDVSLRLRRDDAEKAAQWKPGMSDMVA